MISSYLFFAVVAKQSPQREDVHGIAVVDLGYPVERGVKQTCELGRSTGPVREEGGYGEKAAPKRSFLSRIQMIPSYD